MNPFLYTYNNKRYHTLDYFYKQKFGSKVSKISLNAGFSCPNIDGTVGTGGCIYCSPLGSGDFAGNQNDDLITQFYKIKKVIDKKWKNSLYIGYFQAHTNTYAPLPILKEKYESIVNIDNVVGLSIATRPDAITKETLIYLEELSKRTYLTVELGLQTIHKKTSLFINRCHTLECFEKCVQNLRNLNINVVVHIINGLPFENQNMMIETVKYLNNLDIQGVKIHMLHILKNTKLEKIYKEHPFRILTKEEYVKIVCDELEYLRPEIVIHRITGDPNTEDLIEPKWLTKKICVLNDIDKELKKRNTYQGFRLNEKNLIRQILTPIIKQSDYILDTKQTYTNLLLEYTNKEHILSLEDNSKLQHISCIMIKENNLDKIDISYYMKMLHPRGFILIMTNKKPTPIQNSKIYNFENRLYILKIDNIKR